MEEVALTEEQAKHQEQVEGVKNAFLESIRRKDPKLYYKLINKTGYKPWTREEYFNADIITAKESNTRPNNRRKIYRNEVCSCGSGKKVKHCCGTKIYYTIPKIK